MRASWVPAGKHCTLLWNTQLTALSLGPQQPLFAAIHLAARPHIVVSTSWRLTYWTHMHILLWGYKALIMLHVVIEKWQLQVYIKVDSHVRSWNVEGQHYQLFCYLNYKNIYDCIPTDLVTHSGCMYIAFNHVRSATVCTHPCTLIWLLAGVTVYLTCMASPLASVQVLVMGSSAMLYTCVPSVLRA